jgi:large subunit ribosomal protein L25
MIVQERIEKLAKIRKLDMIPGVMSGQEEGPVNIQVAKKELLKTLAANGQTAVFPCEYQGITHQVYISDLHREVLRRERFQHFSLQIVKATDKIRATVQIHLENKGLVESAGLIVNQVLHEIDVKYGVTDKLEDVVVDVADLKAGDSLLLSDLVLPSYLEIMSSMDMQVLSVMAPKGQAEEEATDEAESAVAPVTAEA